VLISESQRCVNISEGEQNLSACQNADRNLDGTVDATEVALASSRLDEENCPGFSRRFHRNSDLDRHQDETPLASSTPTNTSTKTLLRPIHRPGRRRDSHPYTNPDQPPERIRLFSICEISEAGKDTRRSSRARRELFETCSNICLASHPLVR